MQSFLTIFEIHQKITWEPPKKVNGQLSYYMVRAKLLERSYPTHRDYCLTREHPYNQNQ